MDGEAIGVSSSQSTKEAAKAESEPEASVSGLWNPKINQFKIVLVRYLFILGRQNVFWGRLDRNNKTAQK